MLNSPVLGRHKCQAFKEHLNVPIEEAMQGFGGWLFQRGGGLALSLFFQGLPWDPGTQPACLGGAGRKHGREEGLANALLEFCQLEGATRLIVVFAATN